MPDRPELPDWLLGRLRTVLRGLPEVTEEPAWVGIRWQIRTATICHAFGGEDQLFRVTFRAYPDQLLLFENLGGAYFRAGWGGNVVGMILDPSTDWAEVAEHLTDSYTIQAPKYLAEQVETGGGLG